jgi:Tfp pilus assembly PilM family ATPase
MSISTASAERAPTARRGLIGLEAGDGRLRYAQRRGGRGDWTVGSLQIDAMGAEGAGDLRELKARVRRAGVPRGTAVCALAVPAIDIFPLHLPAGDRQSIETAVVAQAQAQLSYRLSDAVLDYAILPERVRRPGTTTVPVLVFAAPRELVERLLALLEGIGLVVERLMTPAGVLAPCVDEATRAARHLLLATGEQATSISVVQDGAVLLERILPWGTVTLVDRLRQELNLPETQCRALLEVDGPRREATEPAAADGRPLASAMQEILGPTFRWLAHETAGCVGYCDSFLNHEPAISVVVSGPLGHQRMLREVLGRELELPVCGALECLHLPGRSPHEDASAYAAAIGGALWTGREAA